MNDKPWSDESQLEKDFRVAKEALARLEKENSSLKLTVDEFLKCVRAIHDLTEILQLSSVYLSQGSVEIPKQNSNSAFAGESQK